MDTQTPPTKTRKRLLSIDGGGLAGLIPAESLILIEKQLDDLTESPQPLCDRFDLIGGTSTGAILAAGLALGLSAKELRDFYLNHGREIFTRSLLPVQLWHKYPSGPLEKKLKEVLGQDTTLGSDRLRTTILIVTKNATAGSTWFFTNNRNGRFFQRDTALPLWQVVRASTAAPTYFPPQKIAIPDDTGQKQTYEFIDGGVSSYNNASFQVFLEATTPQYGFGWPTGTTNLLLLSLGTGYNPITIAEGKAADYNLLCWARYLVKELMADANLQQNMLMHLIGERPPKAQLAAAMNLSSVQAGTPSEDALNRVAAGLGTNKLLTYQRITISLTRERLETLGLGDIDPVKVRELDAADQIENLRRIGEKVAQEQVDMKTLMHFF
ncbi:MAG TPA: patatin-like phospholipase family protein [Terriglobales bacterium]|nr:patatin-like phospholipase family protein [Terriglobales bacterium]